MAPREAGVSLQPPRRRSAPLEAGLLGVSRELRLEQQRQLPVAGLDDLDRGLELVDGPVGVPRHGQRVRKPASRGREELRLPDLRDRRREVVDRLRRPEAVLRRAELDEDLQPGRGRRGLGQRAPQERDRGRRRSAPQGIRGHPPQELDPLGVPARLRVRDLGGDPLLGRAALGEDLGRARVRPGALVGADVRVDGLPHDRVPELEGRRRPQDRAIDQQVGGACRLVLLEPGQARGLGQPGAVAQHRDGAHEGGRGRGAAREAQEHRLGDRGRAQPLDPGRLAGVRRQPLLPRLAQERLEEERVPAGGLAAGRREVVGHRGAEPLLAERRRGRDAQRRRAQHRGLGGRDQPGEVGREPLARARRREDGDRQALQARGQVGEEAQRLGVRPVQVVHREGHGSVGGQVVEQPVEAVQDGERAVGRGRRQRGGARGEERSRQGRGALEQALGVRGRRDGRLQQLPHAAVGEVALELAGPRSEAGEARPGGRAGGRPEQARLAQPGRALHEDGLAAPMGGLAQGMGDRRQLALALEEPLRHLEGHVTPGPWTAPRPPYRRPGSARFREPRRGGPRRGRGDAVVRSGRWRPDRWRTAT